MARDFTPSIALNASPLATVVPISMAAWFYADIVTGARTIFGLGGNSTSARHEWTILNVGTAFWALTQAGPSGNVQAISTAVLSASTWYHGCGVFAANNDRRAYINGGNKVTETSSVTPGAVNIHRSTIGQRPSNLDDQPFDGKIAEIGVWNIALTDADVAILAKGYSPLLVRPEYLLDYIPLIRTEDRGVVAGSAFTSSGAGSLAVGTHPRVFYPMLISPPSLPAAVLSSRSYGTIIG